MKKILLTIVALFLITLPTLLPYFNSQFFYTQDYIFIARLHQISAALSDGHFPVRWAPDLRYGEPTFNFYASLPYYFGALIHLLGFNFIWVAKILFILSAFLSALGMYLLSNKLFGKKAGVLSAVLYTYAPYKAVDMYVRGALSETWAFVFFPLIFLTSLNLVKQQNKKNIVFLALSLAGLFFSHNVTTLMFLPFLGLWWLYLIFSNKNFKASLQLIYSFILGLGLTAFFLLPATFERGLIQTKYLIVGYFNFRAHFVAIKQFFITFWGYGSSLWGLDDGLSFQVGLVNWIVILLAVIVALILLKNKKKIGLIFILGLSFVFSLFIQHNKSAFIWEAIPLMAFIQFPWRFLGISIFIVAILGGAITPYLKNKLSLIYFVLIFATIFSTLSYFKPKEYVTDSFFDNFLNSDKMRRGIDLTKDYLPIWVQDIDADLVTVPEAENGKIEVLSYEKSATKANARIKVIETAIINAPIAYFPGWTVLDNKNNVNLEKSDKRGLLRFKLDIGEHDIKFEFKDTPIRTVGNLISLSSVLLMIILFTYKRKTV